jgi:hypothetical protein
MIIEVRTKRSTELIPLVRVLEELPIAFKDDEGLCSFVVEVVVMAGIQVCFPFADHMLVCSVKIQALD